LKIAMNERNRQAKIDAIRKWLVMKLPDLKNLKVMHAGKKSEYICIRYPEDGIHTKEIVEAKLDELFNFKP